MPSPRISIASLVGIAAPLASAAGQRCCTFRTGAVGQAVLLAIVLAVAPGTSRAQAEPEPLRLSVEEPRAYGYQVGDTVTRQLVIDVPRRLRLDDSSLPALGRHGPALELRSLGQAAEASATGTRLTLSLEYQIFASPLAVRAYDLPVLNLRFDGTPRAETLRVDVWPVVVAPLVPEVASSRRGLGELQPDTAPVLRDTTPERQLLAACAAVALAVSGYLALVYVGRPWLAGRQRPFTRAYRRLRADRAAPASVQTWQDACRALHTAFNDTAGQVVFADAVDGFLRRAPRFAPLGEDIRAFFARSQAGFFEGGAPQGGAAAARERDWLLDFARACRNAERGTA